MNEDLYREVYRERWGVEPPPWVMEEARTIAEATERDEEITLL